MSSDELGLGAAIRAWRDRLAPESVGRVPTHGRRTPGLRREDLADLAGLSVDYVVRLEQGRATNPSAQVAADWQLVSWNTAWRALLGDPRLIRLIREMLTSSPRFAEL